MWFCLRTESRAACRVSLCVNRMRQGSGHSAQLSHTAGVGGESQCREALSPHTCKLDLRMSSLGIVPLHRLVNESVMFSGRKRLREAARGPGAGRWARAPVGRPVGVAVLDSRTCSVVPSAQTAWTVQRARSSAAGMAPNGCRGRGRGHQSHHTHSAGDTRDGTRRHTNLWTRSSRVAAPQGKKAGTRSAPFAKSAKGGPCTR